MRIAGSLRLFGIVMLAGAVSSGCSQPDRAASSGAPASTVRFALAADPQSLDPLFAHVDANSVEQQVARLAFEPFIDVDEHGTPVPVLLDRIPTVDNGGLSRDGRTITYVLRRGVRWQDGVAVTAHDVVWTLHAILDDRNPVRSRAGYDRVANAEALNERTVRITLKEPWAPAVATLFSYGTAPQYVLPAHLLEKESKLDTSAFASHPVGNGAYRFVSWTRGDHLVYEANPSYWRGAPKVARLDIRIVPDPGTNFTLLQSGGLDWNLMSPSQRQSLGTPAQLAFRTVPLALVAGIAINVTHPPLDDVRVRRALAASIDRASISKKITFGRYPVVDTAQPLSSWARDASVHEPAYDPAAADRLLDAAGWKRGADGVRAKDGKPLALTYVQFPESQTGVRVATVVESELRARGLRVTIKSLVERAAVLAEVAGRRARERRVRPGVRAVADGRRSRRLVPAVVRRQRELHALVRPRRRCARTPRARRAEPRRAPQAVRADPAARGGRGTDRVLVQPVVLVRVPHRAERLLPRTRSTRRGTRSAGR